VLKRAWVDVQTERLVEVQEQLARLGSSPNELHKGLQHVLDKDAAWPYEKADLLHWVKLLDILDAVLAKEDSSDEHLVAVLKFTRLLLENSSNRHVYNSYEVRAFQGQRTHTTKSQSLAPAIGARLTGAPGGGVHLQA
jgi:hypothetical protein